MTELDAHGRRLSRRHAEPLPQWQAGRGKGLKSHVDRARRRGRAARPAASAPFKGQIAGLQQFDHALTEAEIAKLAARRRADRRPRPMRRAGDRPGGGEVWRPGKYAIKTGRRQEPRIQSPRCPRRWRSPARGKSRFAPDWGAPGKVTLEKLDLVERTHRPRREVFLRRGHVPQDFNVPAEMLGERPAVVPRPGQGRR